MEALWSLDGLDGKDHTPEMVTTTRATTIVVNNKRFGLLIWDRDL